MADSKIVDYSWKYIKWGAKINQFFSSNIDLWEQTFQFVNNICKDRDSDLDESSDFVRESVNKFKLLHIKESSHGCQHANDVTILAFQIAEHEMKYIDEDLHDKLFKYILLGSWLHDVADHKYDTDGKLKEQLITFILKIAPNECTSLLKIIDHISYSKENKAIMSGNTINFKAILGEFGATIRNIISDADKLLALGEDGFSRCIQYAIEHYFKVNKKEISISDLRLEILNHSKEKLLRLKDEFIRTEHGKELAKIKHEEFVNKLKSTFGE